jgi:hypothetical protein
VEKRGGVKWFCRHTAGDRWTPPPGGGFAGEKKGAPLAHFVSEHAEDPSRRPPGEEVSEEATIPTKEPRRALRLAVKRGDTLTLLPLN